MGFERTVRYGVWVAVGLFDLYNLVETQPLQRCVHLVQSFLPHTNSDGLKEHRAKTNVFENRLVLLARSCKRSA